MTDLTPGPEILVNTTTANLQSDPAIAALTGGGYVIVWASYEGSYGDVYAQLYDSAGNEVGGESLVNTTTQDQQQLPAVAALADGGYVVTWSSAISGIGSKIVAQRYDTAGNPIGGETAFVTPGSYSYWLPAVGPQPDGGYVLTWASNDGYLDGVYAQRVDPEGNAVGSAMLVNTTTDHTQTGPDVAVLGDGGYVIVWQSYGQDGPDYGVFMRHYDSGGNPLAGETLVNTTTTLGQYAPSIAALSDGGYVVTWVSIAHDPSAYGVYAQRYDAGGNAIGGETFVSTATGNALSVDVSSLADGGYAITWQGIASSYDTFMQCFDAAGNTVGGQTLVDSVAGSPAVVSGADGSVVVVWNSEEGDIHAKWFSPDDTTTTFTGTTGSDVANATNGILTGFTGGSVAELQDATGDTFNGLEGNDSVVAGAGDDTIDGGDGNDTLNGGDGDDSVSGGAGSDTLTGGSGDDTLDGGAELVTERIADILDYSADTAGVYVDMVNGTATGSGIGNDTLSDFERVIGGSGDDTLIAAGGGSGMSLTGGPGDDTLIGVGDGNGLGGAGDLTGANYSNDTAGVTVNLSTGIATGSLIGTDTLTGIRVATGGSGNDTIIGDANINIFTGGAGDDFISGGGGNDALQGLQGNDFLDGGDGIDLANYVQDTGGVSGSLVTGIVIGSLVGADTLANMENFSTGSGNDILTGDANANRFITRAGNDQINAGAGNDSLIAGAGDDTLSGEAGDDILAGESGNDAMDGGKGNDTFQFNSDFGNDTINGFDAKPGGGQDLLDIFGLGVTALDFASRVTITDLGADTLVTIADSGGIISGTILLLGVNGSGQNVISQSDFILLA